MSPPARTLVTGASCGIGAALSRAFAARGESLVLTARRSDRLEQLAADLRRVHGVEVITVTADLALPGAASALVGELRCREVAVQTLVNNAGFGLRGDFHGIEWSRGEAMLQLMVTTPVALCHALLPSMREHRQGRILNVASLAGLVPGLAGSTLYSASKAFLIRFSQALAAENRASGVRVLVVCPGYVRSEFHAALGPEAAARTARLPAPFWMEAEDLAARSLAALDRGQVLLVPGLLNRSLAALGRYLPDRLASSLSTGFSRTYRR
jgi:short-subunit dehydrogenase